MTENYNVYDVVQFNEKHQWCSCLGIMYEFSETKDDIKYMIGIPLPDKGTVYIYSLHSKNLNILVMPH